MLILFVYRRRRKLKGQSRMDNTETLATSDTQVTEGRQRKRKNVTQKTKMMIHIPSKAWVNLCL